MAWLQVAKDFKLKKKVLDNRRIVVVGKRASSLGKFVASNLTDLGFEAAFYNEDTFDFWSESHVIYFDSVWDFNFATEQNAETHFARSDGRAWTPLRSHKPKLLVLNYNGDNYDGPWPSRTFSVLNLRFDGESFQQEVLAFLADQE